MKKIRKLYLRLFGRLKVRTGLIIFFLLISVLPLVFIGYYSYVNSKLAIESKVGFFSKELVNQIRINIEGKVEEVEKSTTQVISDFDMLKLISINNNNSFQREQANIKITEYLTNIVMSNQDLEAIIIVKPNNEDIIYRENINDEQVATGNTGSSEDYLGRGFEESVIYRRVVNADGKAVWVTSLDSSPDKIFVMRKIVNVNDFSTAGVLVYIMDKKIFNNVYSSIDMGVNSSIVLFNDLGRLISFSSNSNELPLDKEIITTFINNKKI